MIQQICLNRVTPHSHVDFDKPMELFINAQDYAKFEKAITVLFDEDSIKRIKKARTAVLSS